MIKHRRPISPDSSLAKVVVSVEQTHSQGKSWSGWSLHLMKCVCHRQPLAESLPNSRRMTWQTSSIQISKVINASRLRTALDKVSRVSKFSLKWALVALWNRVYSTKSTWRVIHRIWTRKRTKHSAMMALKRRPHYPTTTSRATRKSTLPVRLSNNTNLCRLFQSHELTPAGSTLIGPIKSMDQWISRQFTRCLRKIVKLSWRRK